MSESPVGIFLRNTSLLDGFASVSRSLFVSVVALVAIVIAAIFVDAALALPVWLRLAIDVGFIVCGLLCLVNIARNIWSNRFDEHKSARQVEERLKIHDNTLVNTIDLTDESSGHTSPVLKETAIKRGNDLSRELSPFEIVRFGPMLKALLLMLLLGTILLLGYFGLPQVFSRVLPRYLDPLGGHPAYTSLIFDVQVEPDTIFQGQSAAITVVTSGPSIPQSGNLIQVFESGDISTPLKRSADGEFSIELSNLQNSFECYVETEHGQSNLFQINVLPLPTFEKVWINYDFPDYTGWESQKRLLDSRGIIGMQGTEVTFEVESNIDLGHGEMALSMLPGENVPGNQSTVEQLLLTTDEQEPRKVRGSFVLAQQNEFSVQLFTADNLASMENLSGNIVSSPDRPPQIQIQAPESHVIAVEGWQVPVRIQVADDVAVEKVLLTRSVNRLGSFSVDQTGEVQGKGFGAVDYVFDLGQLGAKAGDLITYYATVVDNYPPEFPGSDEHIVSTSTNVIQVISLEEYEELARQNYRMDDVMDEVEETRQQLSELQERRNEIVEQLQELQEKMAAGEELSEADQRQMEQLQKQLEEFAAAAQELAEQLRERAEQTPIYEFEESYQEMLEQLAEQLEKQSDMSQDVSQSMEQNSNSQPMSPEEMKEAIEQFMNNDQPFDSESQQERDDMQQDLQNLAGAEKMLEQVNRMSGIVQQQREIADRMSEFKDQEELTEEQQRRLQQLAKQQDLLREELKDTMEKMEKAAQEASDDLPKASQSLQEIVNQLRESGVLDDQQQASQSGQQGQPKPAHEGAEQAAQKLEAMQCDCNGNSLSQEMMMGDSPLSIPKQQMSKSMQQLAQSMQMPSMNPGQQGQQGEGQRSGVSQASLFGPHKPSNENSDPRRGRNNSRQDGFAAGNDRAYDQLAPESLTPESRETQLNGQSNLQGVPSQYVDHARAYLERLTEEPNTQSPQKD